MGTDGFSDFQAPYSERVIAMLSSKRFLSVLGGGVIALSLMLGGNFAFAEVDLSSGADTKVYKEKKKKSGKKSGKKANKNSVVATH